MKGEKMSSTGEIRVHKNRGYTIIPNDILRDMNLTLKAKALLGLMLSLPDDWDYTVAGLTKLVKEGYDSVDSGIKELIKFKYVYREESRKEKGYFKYIYHIFECPNDNYFLDRNNPVGENRVPDERIAENTKQLNKDNKIDKIDKTIYEEKIEHNLLTKELIRLNYLDGNDELSSFYFDQLFQKYLSEGRSYQELYSGIHYIVPRVIERNYIDEYGYEIKNRYGYFKNAIESNFEKLEKNTDELWSETELTNMLDNFKMNKKEGDLYR